MLWRPALLLLAGCFLLALVRTQAAPPPAFDKVGIAFLQKHCVACHNEKTRRADVSLHHLKTDADLVTHRKLVEKALRVLKAGEMPPNTKPRPAVAELDAFTGSVAAVLDHHDRTARPDPGRVTVRRLNRAEYNNTIRDLVGVDFSPADDFPSDDIGHGFDNIGDVLTLSPVLAERYLAAAESIVERAIVVNPPPVPRRYLSGRFLQPAPPDGDARGRPRFRQMKPADSSPINSGPFTAPADYLKFSADADLILRARLYAETKGKSPVKVALFISGGKLKDPSPDAEVDQLLGANLKSVRPLRILKTFEITARDAKKAQQIEFPIQRRGDIQRAGVAVIRPPAGEEPAELFIEHIWSEGPLETRPKSHLTLLATTKTTPAEQTREVIGRFLPRAFRRPATAEEVERYSKLVDRAVAAGQKWEAGIQLAFQAALVSPKFLFRLELDDRPGTEPTALDEFQLASRLSYFLWSSMPDPELFDLAAKKQLVANLDAQVRRMLKDPKSAALTENFAMQWLQLRRLKTHAPDSKLFPRFDDALRKAMLKETELFFDAIVREDRSILDLIDADFTFLNDRLKRHYGIGGSTPPRRGFGFGRRSGDNEFVRVKLDPKDGRGGILTHGSVLTVTSNPTRTSPVKRGKWVLEQLLGTPPPPPPPDVPELDEKKVLTGSLRQQMEQHRQKPSCAACHAKMDPLGFAFENFDAVGAFRAKEGGTTIDASGELPGGKKFNGPAELKAILKDKKDLVARNLAEKILIYALGRGLESYDRRAVDGVVAALAKNDYRFSTLITETVKSYPFRYRRGQETSK
jgi:hypothetical protein